MYHHKHPCRSLIRHRNKWIDLRHPSRSTNGPARLIAPLRQTGPYLKLYVQKPGETPQKAKKKKLHPTGRYFDLQQQGASRLRWQSVYNLLLLSIFHPKTDMPWVCRSWEHGTKQGGWLPEYTTQVFLIVSFMTTIWRSLIILFLMRQVRIPECCFRDSHWLVSSCPRLLSSIQIWRVMMAGGIFPSLDCITLYGITQFISPLLFSLLSSQSLLDNK